MRVRAIDVNGDWTFGKGQNDYKVNQLAVQQNIQTRLNSFLGDCFFAVNDGIDWFNLVGGKDFLALNLAISACIKNTPFVVNMIQLNVSLTSRIFSISYSVNTTFGVLSGLTQVTS